MLKIWIVLLTCGLVLSQTAPARELSEAEAFRRAEGLRVLRDHQGADLQVAGEVEGTAARTFVSYYFDYIQPRLNAEANSRFHQKVLHSLVTEWLALSLEENETWKAQLDIADQEVAAFERDRAMWLIQIDEWAALGRGLSGSLADFAMALAVSGDMEAVVKQWRAMTDGKILDAATLTLIPESPAIVRTRIATGQVEGRCDERLTGH
jgi:hypothetical protein